MFCKTEDAFYFISSLHLPLFLAFWLQSLADSLSDSTKEPGMQTLTRWLFWDIQDQDNHNGVITHLEPDILEYEVKWALESITMNKASGGDGIPVELFQIMKDDAVNMLHSICQQVWKTQQWPQDWERSVFIPTPKNAQTTAQLHSSHTLVK